MLRRLGRWVLYHGFGSFFFFQFLMLTVEYRLYIWDFKILPLFFAFFASHINDIHVYNTLGTSTSYFIHWGEFLWLFRLAVCAGCLERNRTS